MISPLLILGCVGLYFGFILIISFFTSRNSSAYSYFLGNKVSPWYVVAFGMLADSLSGVTFISVPGAVGTAKFGYMQLVFGYFFGYIIISQVLLPLYYRRQFISIYSYLGQRFGYFAEKTGSILFILSRLLGAGARLYLTASVIQLFFFDPFHIPFWFNVSVTILLIILYTTRGGIKTLVWTDTFQSLFLLLGVLFSLMVIGSAMQYNLAGMVTAVSNSDYAHIFFWDWREKSFFFKQFFGGVFIAVAMTGLDQNMMQKNLSCKSLAEAQKNISWFSVVMVITNVFFLCLGALLWMYKDRFQIDLPLNIAGKPDTDKLFPILALHHLGIWAGLSFILGLTAATFSSADSVLTTLTTTFYVDILQLDKDITQSESSKRKKRTLTHIAFAFLLLSVILLFKAINSSAVIDTVLRVAGYTYGPLLGLFFFGILTRRSTIDKYIPFICLLSPLLIYVLDINSQNWLGGYKFSSELLIVNGLLTFTGLWLVSSKKLDKSTLS